MSYFNNNNSFNPVNPLFAVGPKVNIHTQINEFVNKLMTHVKLLCDGELLIDDITLLNLRMESLSISSAPWSMKSFGVTHCMTIMWGCANAFSALSRARSKLEHDTHINYALFFLSLVEKSAWYKNHAGYDHGFVLQEQHNALMHALTGNTNQTTELQKLENRLKARMNLCYKLFPEYTVERRLDDFNDEMKFLYSELYVCANDEQKAQVYRDRIGVYQRLIDERLDANVDANRDVAEMRARRRNGDMHALNGNGKHQRDFNKTKRAYMFDENDPQTWKFGISEAHFFVRSVKNHHMVALLGEDKVVSLMLKRRGVRAPLAFAITYNHFKATHVDERPRVTLGDFVTDVVKKSSVTTAMKGLFTAVAPEVTVKISDSTAGKIDETNTTFMAGTATMNEGLHAAASAINNLAESAQALGQKVDSFTPKLTTDFLLSLLGESGKNPLVVRTIKVLRDVIIAWEVDSLSGTIALSTLLAETNTTTYAVLITACVTIMKQFTKWCDDDVVVKKADGDWVVDGAVLTPLYNLITSYVFGLTKAIPTINGMFTFAKNMSTPVDYLVEGIKQLVNYVWRTATGHDLVVTQLDKLKQDVKILMKNIVNSTSVKVDHDVLTSIKTNLQKLKEVAVAYAASNATKEDKVKLTSFIRTATDYVASCGVEVELVSAKPRPVVVAFYGKTGAGKTSIPALVAAAVGKSMNWQGNADNWHSVFSLSDDGFQAPLPGECRSVQIDEPFVDKDSTVTAGELKNFLLFVGINPFQHEGATLDHKNDFLRVLLAMLTYNTIVSETGLHNPEASHRRVDLKFELIPNKPGTNPFSLMASMPLDEIWSFKSANTLYTFTDVVSMIVVKMKEYAAGSRNFDVVRAQLLRDFQPIDIVPTQAVSLFANDDSVRGDLLHAQKFFTAPQAAPRLGVPKYTKHEHVHAPSPSANTVTRKGHVTRDVHRHMKTEISYDDLSAILAEFPEGEVDVDYVRRHLDYSVQVSGDGVPSIAAALDLALAPTQVEMEAFKMLEDDGCVFKHGTHKCLVHRRPLACATLIRAKQERAISVSASSVYSMLLDAGQFVYDKIDHVLRDYCGSGLKNTVFSCLVGVIGGYAIGTFINVLLGSITTLSGWLFNKPAVKKAYGNQYAIQTHTLTQLPAFVLKQHLPQAETKSHVLYTRHGRQESTHKLLSKTHLIVVGVSDLGQSVAYIRVNVQTIGGRVGWTVKHGFEAGGVRICRMVLPPPHSKVLFVRDTDGYDPSYDFMVQTEFDPQLDRTFVIFPKGLNMFVDTSDRYISASFNATLFNQAQLYYRPSVQITISDDLSSAVCEPTSLPLLSMAVGRCSGITTCGFEDGTVNAVIEFVGSAEPPNGACGGAIVPMDTHFGENYLGISLVGYSKSKQCTYATFLTREDIMAFYSRHPDINSGVRVIDQTGITPATIVADFSRKCEYARAERPGFQPSHAGLYRSAIFNCLTGVELKIDGELKFCPPCERVPSPVRETGPAFKKYPPFIKSVDPNMLADIKLCCGDIADTMLAAGREFPYIRQDFLTVDEALNGTKDGSVIGMNMESSSGYTPDFKGKRGNKHDFCDRLNDRWTIKPEFVEEAEAVFQDIVAGNVMMYVAKTTAKGELRMPGKVARLVSSKPFLILLALRRVFAPLQAFIAFGAPRNGTARGIDPTGPSGEALQRHLHTFPNKLDGDAKAFDASQDAGITNTAIPLVLTPLAQFVYPTKKVTELRLVCEVAAIMNHLAVELFGPDYFLHIDGNISGDLLTTDCNDIWSALCIRIAWLGYYRTRYNGSLGVFQAFHKHVRYATQGDDIAGSVDCDFNLYDMELGYGKCLIKFTSSDKSVVDAPYASTIRFLKREGINFHGKRIGRLPLVVLHEILSYIRTTVEGRPSATLTNVQAAFTEILFYGKENYERMRATVNLALARGGCDLYRVTYEDQLASWSEKWSTSQVVRAKVTENTIAKTQIPESVTVALHLVEKKSDTTFEAKRSSELPLSPLSPPFNSSDLLVAGLKNRAAQKSMQLDSTSSSSTDGSDRSIVAPVIKEAKGLTQFLDGIRKVGTSSISVSENILGMQDPYPDQGVKPVLEREYQVGSFLWKTTDLATANTPIYTASFPEAMFAIPKLFATLSAFRYLQTKVKLSFRINATLFTQGRLLIRYVPSCPPGTFRSQMLTAIQSEHVLLSPSSATTAEVTIPWVCPMTFMDMDNYAAGYGGQVEVYVLHPCASASAVALPDMYVNVFASFVDPIVAGMNTSNGPSDVMLKSAIEAVEKAAKGVLVGVKTTKDMVAGGMKLISQFEELGSLLAFDRPNTVAASQPFIPRMGNDLVNTVGVTNGIVLGSDPAAAIKTEQGLIGSVDAHGSFLNVMRRPGVILTSAILVGDEPATAAPYFDIPVKPSYAWEPLPNNFSVSPLAYNSQFFRYWRGSIKYKIIFSASKLTNCRVRISYLPGAYTTGVLPESKAGDVTSAVVIINGDTEFDFSIPYLAPQLYKSVAPFDDVDTNDSSATGIIKMTLLSPIATAPGNTAADIWFTLYMAAGEDFQVLRPDSWSARAEPIFDAPAVVPQFVTNQHTRNVIRKSFVTEEFKKPFPGLVPTKLMMEDKVCSPDRELTVVGLMKRFEKMVVTDLEVSGNTFPANAAIFNLVPSTGSYSWHKALYAQFITHRGSICIKIMKTVFPTATTSAGPPAVTTFTLPITNRVQVTWSADAGDQNWRELNGMIWNDTTFNPWTEVTLPAYDLVHCRETIPALSDIPLNPNFTTYTDGAQDPFELYAAVGDDYSLGPYVGPPLVHVTPALEVIAATSDTASKYPLETPAKVAAGVKDNHRLPAQRRQINATGL